MFITTHGFPSNAHALHAHCDEDRIKVICFITGCCVVQMNTDWIDLTVVETVPLEMVVNYPQSNLILYTFQLL